MLEEESEKIKFREKRVLVHVVCLCLYISVSIYVANQILKNSDVAYATLDPGKGIHVWL